MKLSNNLTVHLPITMIKLREKGFQYMEQHPATYLLFGALLVALSETPHSGPAALRGTHPRVAKINNATRTVTPVILVI